jgi:UDP-4-amino-4,6-dideoxy-N-acetyl-beta-L-altrosamine N-acetyltransferase
MTAGDLEQVLSWRNHPDVRSFMYSQHEISLDEHTSWFFNASKDPKRHLNIFEADNIPRGFFQIYQSPIGNAADWGFYLAPDAPKGTGRELGKAAIRYAFETLKLHKVCGQALAYNERSIKFHQKLNFKKEGVLRKQFFNGKQYHDVVCFGLLVTEWQKKPFRRLC